MGRTKDLLSEVAELAVLCVTSVFNFIWALLQTFLPLLELCPQILLVLVALYIIPIITYRYSDYTIIFVSVPLDLIISVANIGIAIWNTISPVVWPIYALYLNTLFTIMGIVITALYRYACPGAFPPTDFNADCPVVVKVVTMITAYVDAVEAIINSVLNVIATVLTAVGSITQQSIVSGQTAAQIAAQRATCSNVSCSEDDWVSSLKLIIAWLMDLIDWLLNGVMPIVFMTVGFCVDVMMFIMSQLIALLLQRAQFLVSLLGGIITLMVPHNPDTVPDQTTDPQGYENFAFGAVQFLQVNQTLTSFATGPPELKSFYLTVLQLISDVITTVYDIIMGFLMALDKTQCYLNPTNIGACIIGNECKFIFGRIFSGFTLFCDPLGRKLGICIDLSQLIVNSCLKVFGGTCECDLCPSKPTAIYYFILASTPCNLNVVDPVTGARCCTQQFSVVRLVAQLMSGHFT